jgi:hypothetical protein
VSYSNRIRRNIFLTIPSSSRESFAQNNQALFVGMFYITIMPSALMFSVVGLVLQFYADKHGLLRRWARLPEMGPILISTSIAQMFFTVIVSMTMANRYFGGWPFDFACPVGNTTNYEYCYRGHATLLYPEKDYMSTEQALVTKGFKYCAAGCMAAVSLYYGKPRDFRCLHSVFLTRSFDFSVVGISGRNTLSIFWSLRSRWRSK